MDLAWASPVGIAAFFAGSGIFFWGLFHGLEALARAKQIKTDSRADLDTRLELQRDAESWGMTCLK